MERESLQTNKRIEWIVWGAILVTVAGISTAFVHSRLEQAGNRSVGQSGNPGSLSDLRPIAQLPDFTLTNQAGRAVSLADLRGQVWVADIIFTRCAGPCPVMTQRMSELQKALPANSGVKLLTLTTDPQADRPEVLKQFGERFGADFGRWTFLTGNKEQIARLAVDGLKLVAMEKKPEERETERDLFIHSQLFVLIDRQGRLRGSIESYDPDMKPKVLAAVKQLAREEGSL